MSDRSPIPEEIRGTLDAWKLGIGENDLDLIGDVFAPEALFQGLRPEPLYGPDGVKEYYGSQPRPLSVDFDVLSFETLGDQAAVVCLRAVFHPAGRDPLPTHITLVLEHSDSGWLINHYHVSVIN